MDLGNLFNYLFWNYYSDSLFHANEGIIDTQHIIWPMWPMKIILLSPFQLKLVVGSFYLHQWRNRNQMAFWWFQGRYQMHIGWNRAVLGPRVQQCEPPSVCEYHVKVLSKKTKNLKTMNDLKNFGKQLIQFLLLPQFAIVFIFIIACFYILILPNKNHSWDFI